MVEKQERCDSLVEMNMDFENEFTSDEEVSEMLKNLTDLIGEQAAQEDCKTAVINPMKVKMVLCTYKLLKYITKGSKVNVTYELNKPYKSMGSVTVVGKELSFSKSEWFVAAARLASNVNVYPKTNGMVQMDFTFHGLTTTIE